ncbi:DUF6415 family natural product biosynthesis protein [Streptomyces sp. NPDC048389]|uniref:DUF6415 family natural product biosynthesis protein n=1 Tax=Streptomyces sp. NPDC048389 TaxID=3154622 RepID=UPI0034543E58
MNEKTSCERGRALATAARALEGAGDEEAQETVQLLRVHIGLLVDQVEELALALPAGEQGRCLALASVGEARRKLRAGGVPGSGPQRRAEQLARVCRALLHHWEELAAASAGGAHGPAGAAGAAMTQHGAHASDPRDT